MTLRKTIFSFLLAWVTTGIAPALADGARNYISIVGSTTVQPFSQAVAEKIAKSYKVKAPMIESTGTSGGVTLFCEGIGMAYPDIVNASRALRQKELDTCRGNGVNEIVEIKVGSGGVVLTQAAGATPLELTRKDLFLALVKRLPDPTCKSPCDKLIANPYKTWKQLNPALPDQTIEILGPPASSGVSEALMETVMDAGCDAYPSLLEKKRKNETEYKRICHSVREDGVYAEDTGSAILSSVASRPGAVGIVTYAAYRSAESRLKAIAMEDSTPNMSSLASQSYPLTKPLLFYVKKAHVDRVPGLDRYVAEFTSDKAWGPKGYLVKSGLVPMTAEERSGYAAVAKDLKPMTNAGQLLPIGKTTEEIGSSEKAAPAPKKQGKGKKSKRQK